MVIDAHIHIHESGELSGYFTDPEFIISTMDDYQIDKAIVLSIAGINDNKLLYKKISKYNNRFILFAGVDVHSEKSITEVIKIANNGECKGLKIHPRLQQISPMDKVLFPIYEKAIEHGLPIVFDGHPQSSSVAIENLQPYVYDRLAKLYPQLKIIIAHAGVHRIWDAYFVARSNENVYLDISYVCTKYQGLSFMKDLSFILENLDKKIIYGSDFPEINMGDYMHEFLKIVGQLSKNKTENIMGHNIARLINLQVANGI